jgi:hypothetical protein
LIRFAAQCHAPYPQLWVAVADAHSASASSPRSLTATASSPSAHHLIIEPSPSRRALTIGVQVLIPLIGQDTHPLPLDRVATLPSHRHATFHNPGALQPPHRLSIGASLHFTSDVLSPQSCPLAIFLTASRSRPPPYDPITPRCPSPPPTPTPRHPFPRRLHPLLPPSPAIRSPHHLFHLTSAHVRPSQACRIVPACFRARDDGARAITYRNTVRSGGETAKGAGAGAGRSWKCAPRGEVGCQRRSGDG